MLYSVQKTKIPDQFVRLDPPTLDDRGLPALWRMLQTMRPEGSAQEHQFVEHWLLPLPGARQDTAGNVIVEIADADGRSAPVLWSSHTDTVHNAGGVQRIAYNDKTGRIGLSKRETQANCLGADCTTGVWLMREMILVSKPGLYVFHRGEECGGLGSSHIAKKTPKLLEGIKFAIAFDRKSTTSIITHQYNGRCCSQAFVDSLSSALALPVPLRADDGGTFTDTANYDALVPECTNISVGYYDQHTSRETQDVHFAGDLLSALLALDVGALVAKRDPVVFDDDDYYDGYDNPRYRKCNNRNSEDYEALVSLVNTYPDIAAELLYNLGGEVADVEEILERRGGSLADLY